MSLFLSVGSPGSPGIDSLTDPYLIAEIVPSSEINYRLFVNPCNRRGMVVEDTLLPLMTQYGIMKSGKVKLLPFYLPVETAKGVDMRGLAGKRRAVMLANHGSVVAG